MAKIGWVKTSGFLTVVEDGKPISIPAGSDNYKAALKCIKKDDKKGLSRIIHADEKLDSYSKGAFRVKGEKIVDKEERELPAALAKKTIEFCNKKYPVTALKKFNENLYKNPNKHSVEQLFTFIDRNHFAITSDGSFLAYKYVTRLSDGTLVDSRTKSFVNNVGCIVAMNRDKCDPDPEVTCSSGLHVAAYEYASRCGAGEVIIEVKVNPKDVVAVPRDYNCQKMRVCRYVVLKKGSEEVKKSYLSSKYAGGETKTPIMTSKDTVSFEGMSASDIIKFVKDQTGEKINLSPKSKRAVLKKARQIIEKHGLKVKKETVDLSPLSGAKIIALVQEKTGQKITISPKSKVRVVAKAIVLLEMNHYMVVSDHYSTKY